MVVLRSGILSTANQQIAGNLNTLLQVSSGCQAISTLVIDQNGSNATLTLCQTVDPNSTIIYLYSNPIVFTGSADQPYNMTFSNANGLTSIFLNVTGKNGTALNMSQTHCVDATVNGVYLLRQLCGTTGQTSGGATPTPTPTPIPPAPQVTLNSPANGATIPNGTTFQYTPSSAVSYLNATLYGNFTGVWAANVSNASTVTNSTVNSLVTTVPPGNYLWNVQVCDRFANCSFAPANFYLKAQYNATWTQTTQADFAAGNSVNINLTAQPDNATLNSSVSWANAMPAASPPARYVHAMAFDSSRNLTVLFSGYNGTYLGDTWVFNASTNLWTQVVPATSPPARYFHAMAFDSSSNRTVLFGGYNGASLADTWVFNGTNWTQILTAPSPSARNAHAMAFDSARNRTVLFGGSAGAGETWQFNGTNWTQVITAPSPSARGYPSMAFDSARNLTVLFGGFDGTNLGDTWVFNGTNWRQILGSVSSPSGRYDALMAFDSSRNLTVLFGGYNGAYLGDTWTFNGTNWTQVFPATSPSGRYDSAMVFDSSRAANILFGGYNGPILGDTWVFGNVFASTGSLQSQVFDAGQNASWFVLNWSQSLPVNTNVSLQTRTCTLAACADNPAYSAGASCVGALCSQTILSSSGRRYIQWQANLTTTYAFNTPVLSEVNATYGYPS